MRNPKWRVLRISNFVVWRYYSSVNLAQTICGIPFRNPTVLASGIWGVTASSWKRVAEHGAGGVTTKSLWLHEHKGHPNPTIISTEYWTLNAVGVPDAGIEKAREEIHIYMQTHPVPLIANVIAESVEDYAKVAEAILALKPDFLEVNISCPNIEDEFGRPFACSAADASAVTKTVKSIGSKTPVFIKLSPNVPDIASIALSCAEAGADGFTAINTVGPGMAIDLRSRMPILANRVGGLSGRAIKPIAVKCVADIYRATEGKLPVIGTGGVYTGEDALELMIAGASLVGIGTAVGDRGADVFRLVYEEMSAWCDQEGIQDLREIVGTIS